MSLLKKLLKMTKINWIASGGISRLVDLQNLADLKAKNLVGVIIGKALYEQKINLNDAVIKFQSEKDTQ
jgi:phosphoribosylformimino-5-aminoimidazole carboxamide ribotide isomerase